MQFIERETVNYSSRREIFPVLFCNWYLVSFIVSFEKIRSDFTIIVVTCLEK